MLYRRLLTREVTVGNLALGNGNPIRIQTMTTTDTMDTVGTVAQTIRCIEAGAEIVRITAPSKKEAENLLAIKTELRRRGYNTPLVADIHYTPNAAEIAARIVEKVRVNPGNYVDKKKFDLLAYTDDEYRAEIDRIRERFTPLVRICREYGTAMRIGVNHGSLSDRIMSRYGDTPIGMVESALEFLRITRGESYHQVILSMKSSNALVMVQAYRLLVQKMQEEFGACYPLHLGVTEAGDGIDGRVKSAIGIGTLLDEGIGDTIRVSLTEDPEFELPVCRDIVARYASGFGAKEYYYPGFREQMLPPTYSDLPYNPFEYRRRSTPQAGNIGAAQVPVVIADFSQKDVITFGDLDAVGYHYDEITDKWAIGDAAVDYMLVRKMPEFGLPGTLKIMSSVAVWQQANDKSSVCAVIEANMYTDELAQQFSAILHFVAFSPETGRIHADAALQRLKTSRMAVVILEGRGPEAQLWMRLMWSRMMEAEIQNPVVISVRQETTSPDEHIIAAAIDAGSLLLDGMGDGLMLGYDAPFDTAPVPGRTVLESGTPNWFLNHVAFTILQATRTRISRTEYISCPSCGRTLFDLQETTARIRQATHHLKGVKIAIMGCIVNGPGEMADADFGYVGSGPGRITLYKGKEIVKRNVPSPVAVDELIGLLKDNNAWVEKA